MKTKITHAIEAIIDLMTHDDFCPSVASDINENGCLFEFEPVDYFEYKSTVVFNNLSEKVIIEITETYGYPLPDNGSYYERRRYEQWVGETYLNNLELEKRISVRARAMAGIDLINANRPEAIAALVDDWTGGSSFSQKIADFLELGVNLEAEAEALELLEVCSVMAEPIQAKKKFHSL